MSDTLVFSLRTVAILILLSLIPVLSVAAGDDGADYTVSQFKDDCEAAGGEASGDNNQVICDFGDEDDEYISCDVFAGDGGFSVGNCVLMATDPGGSPGLPGTAGTIRDQPAVQAQPGGRLTLPQLKTLMQNKALPMRRVIKP